MATNLSQFRNNILPDVPGCPFFTIDKAVRDAAIKFCEDTHILEKAFEIEDIDYTGISASDNDSLTFDLTTYFTDYIPIKITQFQVDGADFEGQKKILLNDNSNLTGIQIKSTYFFNFPTTTTMKIFPFTDIDANFDLFINLAVKPTSTVATLDDILYEDWRDAIEAYAKYILQKTPKKPWTDLEHAAINKKYYQGEMGRAKIRVSDGFVKGSRHVTGYYF